MSDITEFTCTGCKLSTWSMYDLSGKPHIECPQGGGTWQKSSQDIDYSAYTVTVHMSPDCSPETLHTLGEMMKLLIEQVEKDNIQRSRRTLRAADGQRTVLGM